MKNTAKANQVLSEMIEKFSAESFPQVAAEVFLRRINIPSSNWSYSNRLMMALQGTSDARGFNQWANVQRHVKKGSKAIYILAPSTITRKDDEGKEILNDDGKPQKVVIGFRAVPVFRYEDTEGEPVKYVEDEPELPPLYDVAKSWGIQVTYDGTQAGESGSYNLKDGSIRLCVANPSTFFHELAHAANAKFETLKSGQQPEQEAVAQLTACILSRLYGTENVDAYTWNYLAEYAQDKTPEAVGALCHKVIAKTQKVLDIVLSVASEAAMPEIEKPSAMATQKVIEPIAAV